MENEKIPQQEQIKEAGAIVKETNEPRKFTFNNDEEAKALREDDEEALLNKTIENKDKNSNMSILFGVLTLVFLAFAGVMTALSVQWGWWSYTGWLHDWYIGGFYISIILIPAAICMMIQWIYATPLLRLVKWRKEGKFKYTLTGKDKATIIFGIVTYILFVIVKMILKLVIILQKN